MTITKFENLNDKIVKYLSHLMMKISFSTLFGCGFKITPDINPMYGYIDRLCHNESKTYVNHRQTEEQKSLIFAIPFILDQKK